MNNQREMNVSLEYDRYGFDLPVVQDIVNAVLMENVVALMHHNKTIFAKLKEIQDQIMNALPQNLQRNELKSETNINTPVAEENEDTDQILRDWAMHILNHHSAYLVNNQDEILSNLTTQKYDITPNQRKMLKAISLDTMSRMPEGVEKKQFQKNLNTAIPFGS